MVLQLIFMNIQKAFCKIVYNLQCAVDVYFRDISAYNEKNVYIIYFSHNACCYQHPVDWIVTAMLS